MKKWKDESGVILVEASIYFPIVIFTVFAMIYLGMVKYQESILAFQVQKVANLGAKEIAYPGYVNFADDGSVQSAAVDFKSETDFGPKMKEYYKGGSDHLYNEWKFNYGGEEARLKEELEKLMNRKTFLTGIETTADVKIENYVIGRQITVEAEYGLKSPEFLKYIGVPVHLTLKTAVMQSASNPTELVRNIDLATDLINFLLEKFHMKGKVDAFLKKVEDVKNKIL